MSFEFWLGVALSIPLAILGNILTRPFQRKFGKFSRAIALRRTRTMKNDYAVAKYFKNRPEAFHEFLLYQILNAVVAGAVAGISMTVYIGFYIMESFIVREMPMGRWVAVNLLGLLIMWNLFRVIWIGTKVTFIYHRIHNFDEFERKFLRELVADKLASPN